MNQYDLIVVGSGPSGSRTARLCAEQGMNVLLLERDTHPRGKCCAGGVLERALIQLEDIPDSLIERELDSFVIVRDDEMATCRFVRRVGISVRRDLLDAHLAREAERFGANLYEGEAVTSAIESNDGVEVRTVKGTYRADYLVLAEGSRGRIASNILGPRSLGTVVLGSAMRCDVGSRTDTTLRIHLFPQSKVKGRCNFPLSGASFPLEGAFSFSVVGDGIGKEGMQCAMDSMMTCIDRDFTIVSKGETCFHPIPIAQRPRLCSSRSVVVGDAAGLVSPFSGEGLTYALRSAEMAYRAIRRDRERRGSLSEYQKDCWRNVGKHMRAASMLGPGLIWLTRHLDIESLVSVFSRDSDLVDTVAKAARDEGDWRNVLLKTIPRFPRLFFSSLRS